jgi:hypothetical protein
LTLEPAPNNGLTDAPLSRVFKAELLPAGQIREVRYLGKHIEITFE